MSLLQYLAMNLEETLSLYGFPLPKEDIAEVPASPRDSAKLLVYDRESGEVVTDTFLHLEKYLPEKSLLIFNDTKVIPARLSVFLPTGGKVEILCLSYDKKTKTLTALSPRNLEVGQTLAATKHAGVTVIKKEDSIYTLSFSGHSFENLLSHHGSTPIPPYLKHTTLTEHELREKYQTIFAKRAGSVAAPTASLHFTRRLMKKLRAAGHDIGYITLHVGLGTFAPLSEEHLKTGTLHTEWYEIPKETQKKIARAKREGWPVITVGTTATRTLESAYQKRAVKAVGTTNLFIREGYTWRIIDGMITNFHVPKSSLLMLVSALIGREKLLALYAFAKQKGFKFFSFGDGMLLK